MLLWQILQKIRINKRAIVLPRISQRNFKLSGSVSLQSNYQKLVFLALSLTYATFNKGDLYNVFGETK